MTELATPRDRELRSAQRRGTRLTIALEEVGTECRKVTIWNQSIVRNDAAPGSRVDREHTGSAA